MSNRHSRRTHAHGQHALPSNADVVAAMDKPVADFGPVTLDFAKLVKRGNGPFEEYDRLSKNGTLRPDDSQRRAVL